MPSIPGQLLLNRLLELGLTEMEPWKVTAPERAAQRTQALNRRFPDRNLVVFAERQDSDDCACFDLDRPPGSVSIVHDFATPGWERRDEFEDIRAWLKHAIADFVDFEPWC